MNKITEKPSVKSKCLVKSLSDTIALIVVLYSVYLCANLIGRDYPKAEAFTKVLFDLWPDK